MNTSKKNRTHQESETHYRNTTEDLSIAKWVIDIETMKFVYLNQAVQSLSGFSSEEILKQEVTDFFKSESKDYLTQIIPQRLNAFIDSNERVFYIDEFEQPCKDGSTIWVEVNSFFCINPISKKYEWVGSSRDINKRMVVLKKAHQEQEHREVFIKEAPFAIIEWGKDLEILAWNPMAKHIFGYDEDKALGKNFFELLIPEKETINITQIVEELLSKEGKSSHINNNVTKSGKLILCEWYNTPLFNDAGDFIGVTSIAKDITDFQKAQEEKEKANNNYQQLINELHEGVGIVNLEEEFIFVNPAFENLIGFKSIQLIGKNLRNYIPQEDFLEMVNETKKRKQGKTSSYRTRLITKNGIVKVINISASPWLNEDGEIIGTMALVIDITDQIRANEELNRRYNFEKRIFNISTRFSDNTNFAKKVNNSLNDIGQLSNASSVYVMAFNYKNNLTRYEYTWEKESENITPVSSEYPLDIFSGIIKKLTENEHFYIKDKHQLINELKSIEPYFLENNIENIIGFPIYVGSQLHGFLGIQNISAENNWSKNEFILLRSAGEILCNSIQRKLNEDQIKKLNAQLKEKNNEIEQVLYVTSHDIRSPLVNIIGFTKELNKSVDELKEFLNAENISDADKEGINYLLNEDIPEVLKFINAGGHKIDKLLNALLKISRLGRIPLDVSLVDINQIIQEIIDSLGFQIQENKIELIVTKMPEILTDKNLITQIITNLIDNAIKYLDENRSGIIQVSMEEEAGEYILVVKDNGVGIPKEKQAKVFEIFNRLLPDKADGEGIGLTIIKRAVGRLNGTICLESEFGQGSKFSIRLNKI